MRSTTSGAQRRPRSREGTQPSSAGAGDVYKRQRQALCVDRAARLRRLLRLGPAAAGRRVRRAARAQHRDGADLGVEVAAAQVEVAQPGERLRVGLRCVDARGVEPERRGPAATGAAEGPVERRRVGVREAGLVGQELLEQGVELIADLVGIDRRVEAEPGASVDAHARVLADLEADVHHRAALDQLGARDDLDVEEATRDVVLREPRLEILDRERLRAAGAHGVAELIVVEGEVALEAQDPQRPAVDVDVEEGVRSDRARRVPHLRVPEARVEQRGRERTIGLGERGLVEPIAGLQIVAVLERAHVAIEPRVDHEDALRDEPGRTRLHVHHDERVERVVERDRAHAHLGRGEAVLRVVALDALGDRGIGARRELRARPEPRRAQGRGAVEHATLEIDARDDPARRRVDPEHGAFAFGPGLRRQLRVAPGVAELAHRRARELVVERLPGAHAIEAVPERRASLRVDELHAQQRPADEPLRHLARRDRQHADALDRHAHPGLVGLGRVLGERAPGGRDEQQPHEHRETAGVELGAEARVLGERATDHRITRTPGAISGRRRGYR